MGSFCNQGADPSPKDHSILRRAVLWELEGPRTPQYLLPSPAARTLATWASVGGEVGMGRGGEVGGGGGGGGEEAEGQPLEDLYKRLST